MAELDYMEPLLKYQKKKSFEEEEENSNETEYTYLRNLPDMSEGLIGLCIGDIMGILLSLNSNNTLSLQQQQLLKEFIETLLKTSKSSLSIFKLSIFYLYKLNKKLKEPKVLNIFKTNLNKKNITSMEPIEQAKLLFVVILMLAFKYTEDHCYYISAWSKATGIKSEIIHRVEVEILNLLDHNLFVSKERFESFSSRIIQKINKLKIDLLQSVKISYASSNYSSSEEENSNKCENSLLCRKCCCKRKQQQQESSLMNSTTNCIYKKRRISIDTNDTMPKKGEKQTDNASTFYTLPTTLYDYYNNRNDHVFAKQPLTPPTPNPFVNANNNNVSNINNNKINNTNNLLQVDSLIIPSTPPTSQTSIFEDIERDEEIKNGKMENEIENNKDFEEIEDVEEDILDEEDEVESEIEGEGDEEDDEEEDDDDIKEQLPRSQNAFKSSTMAFILNPDENKIQLDYGQKEQHKLEAKTIPYHYHIPSPSHHKTNFAYDNLKKVNLLEKNEKSRTRTTASIVLPNTSPVGEVASIFPSLSMLSQPQQSLKNDSTPIEDTTNKTISMGLKSLLNENINKSSMNSIIISNSEDDEKSNQCPLKSNFINISNDEIDTNSNINITNTCPYLNNLYTLSNDDITKQNILLSIYNCYAMRNIRHYQI